MNESTAKIRNYMDFRTFIFIGLLVARHVLTESSDLHDWIDHAQIICPQQCVCRYSHLMDLSIARWVSGLQHRTNSENAFQNMEEDLINNNEALFSEDNGDSSRNPLIKFAMCILQANTQPKSLIDILPQDTEALVLLYNDEGKNFTVGTSELDTLSMLQILEIRGPADRSFKLLMDDPLPDIKHVNFESIELVGCENCVRPMNPVHPSQSFDYVPSSEKIFYAYNLTVEEKSEQIELLPYDVYLNELRKAKMASFYGWATLQGLRIHNCRLDQLQWEMFDGLNSLQHLSLEHNEIKIIPSFALYGTMHIKTLSLAHNYILDLHYRALAGLLDLEVLDLSYNHISKLSEMTFPPFPKLKQVDFRYNPISHIFPATFGVMNTTSIMFLGSAVALQLSMNKPFEYLSHLIDLRISNVKIDILTQSIFKGLPSLEILNLKGSIKILEFDAFTEMPGLRNLDLSFCKISHISMDAFIGCKRLEIVNLANNNITHLPPGLFDDTPYLSEIYLNGNRLKSLPSNFFENSALKLVRLTENPWECTCDMMTTWKPKITNRVRGRQQERCVREFRSGKVISCKKLEQYKFDKQMAPRCDNLKNRSIYYALRKNLQCHLHIKQKKMKITAVEVGAVQVSVNTETLSRIRTSKGIGNNSSAAGINGNTNVDKQDRRQKFSKKYRKTIRERNTYNYVRNLNVSDSNKLDNQVYG